ncbi:MULTISPECIES: aminotransferase-like domain-containing protein [Halolamina]|uniref:2-aminoadipate transaminase n=1 Tax=Halolamina pelagica TaxID=699431 RepID=A0A1I5P457_9EURY|nr:MULTISPECIES: PLP-dependent aminotransferase family protein [Halolamina]NHX36616.1 PLP-dependent aminotransferase family protein [Halolamina sp. R1-12]SFP28767.1 2-aminoadipate transaminase [Halolamina pelagica]
MAEQARDDRFDHLFASTVRERLDGGGYGSSASPAAEDAVPLTYGFPYPESFPTAELVAATETVLEEEGADVLQYGGGEYVERLHDGLLAREHDRGIDATRDELIVTNGATYALDAIASTFLDPGDEVLVESPTFVWSLAVLDNRSAELTGVTLDEDGLDPDALEATLDAREAAGEATPKLLYTIPEFQNPTGATLTRERRERVLELAAEYDFLIVADDAYGELRFGGESPPPLAAMDDAGRVIRVGTVSKTIAPGVRTGWIVADEALADQIGTMAAGGTNTFTQSVLGRYFDAGHYQPTLERLLEGYETRRDAMLDALERHLPPGSSWTEPEGGFFLWVTLPEGVDAEDMLPLAAEEGVTYLPGERFFVGDGGRQPAAEPVDDRTGGKRSARLSFSHCTPEELDDGIAALARATEAYLE